MKNEVLLERLKKWQEEPVSHPLTCGNDSSHNILIPEIREGKVVLFCTDCDYIQEDHIPSIFYNERFDEMYEHQKKFLENIIEKTTNKPIGYVKITGLASEICWWKDALGQVCPVYEIYEKTNYYKIKVLRREYGFENEPYSVTGWIPKDYIEPSSEEEYKRGVV